MIRDPSDGSVRDHQPKRLEAQTNAPPEKAKQAARLKESREWLKQYFEPKA